MKKIILLLGIAAFIGTANAQETKVGFKGGLQNTNFSGDDSGDAEPKFGILVGGFATHKISDQFAIQAEVLYSDKGAESKTFEENFTLSYIDIPLMAKFYVNDFVNIHAGPQIGILLSADFDGEDVKEQYRTTDIGAVLGLEYEADLGLVIGVRANFGLTSIGEDYESTSTFTSGNTTTTITTEVEAADVRNTAYQLYVGFAF